MGMRQSTATFRRRAWWALWEQRRRRARAVVVPSPWEGDAFVAENPKLWLRAETLPLNIGDPIALWGDDSGIGNHASQETASSQPTFQEVTYYGKTFTVASFDTVDDGMVTPLVLGESDPFSMLLVWRPADVYASCATISSPSMDWVMGTYCGGMLCFFSNWTGGGAASVEDFYCLEVRVTPGDWTQTDLRLNGVAATVFESGGTASPGNVVFGTGGMDAQPAGCQTPEVLVYDRRLTDEEAWGVRRYLQGKYNFLKV